MLMAVGMVEPQCGIQADGNPHSISNPCQLSHLALPTRMGIKGFLKETNVSSQKFCHYPYTYTPFPAEIICLGSKDLGEAVLMPADSSSSLLHSKNPLLELLYGSFAEFMVFSDHCRSKNN